nr:MAG TPA: hypothetical protein [Caudoviricetes sp.]
MADIFNGIIKSRIVLFPIPQFVCNKIKSHFMDFMSL